VLPRVDDLALSRERVQEGDERGASRIRCTLLHERPGHQLAHPRPVAASWAGTVRVKLELTFLWFAAKPPRSRLSGAGLGDAARPARSRRARRPPHQRGDPVAGTALSRERQVVSGAGHRRGDRRPGPGTTGTSSQPATNSRTRRLLLSRIGGVLVVEVGEVGSDIATIVRFAWGGEVLPAGDAVTAAG